MTKLLCNLKLNALATVLFTQLNFLVVRFVHFFVSYNKQIIPLLLHPRGPRASRDRGNEARGKARGRGGGEKRNERKDALGACSIKAISKADF